MDTRIDRLSRASRSLVAPPMNEEPTTAAIQRYLDALPEDAAAEPIVCELLERAATRLRLLCAALLYRGYPRLTQPPLNLETDEMLGGVVAALLTALVTLGQIATIEPGPGILSFGAVVVTTMFAAENFDPRLMWDRVPA